MVNTNVLLSDHDDILRPTVAGLLVFGDNPVRHLPSAYIEAGVYRGTVQDSNHLVHSEQIKGRLDQQIDAAVAFIDRFMLRRLKRMSAVSITHSTIFPLFTKLSSMQLHTGIILFQAQKFAFFYSTIDWS
ncbi:MAG: hypothetical protein ACE5I1_22530 [bacterium]